MIAWKENIVHSRNDPFDDAWTCHVDLIITHHDFYFALLFSCWTRAMQNHNAKVGLYSHKSILQRPPFPWFFHFSPYGRPVHHGLNYCSSFAPSQTTDQTDVGLGSRVVPLGFFVYFARQEACNHLEMSMRVHTINNCVKNELNVDFLPLVAQKWNFSSRLLTVMSWLTFFCENYLRVCTQFCQAPKNDKIISNFSFWDPQQKVS